MTSKSPMSVFSPTTASAIRRSAVATAILRALLAAPAQIWVQVDAASLVFGCQRQLPPAYLYPQIVALTSFASGQRSPRRFGCALIADDSTL